jgi:hypothetical protein
VHEDSPQDRDIEELKQDAKRLRVMEAQLRLIARVAMASLATVLGFAGSVIYKWQELQIDLSDLKGQLIAHERWGDEASKHMQKRLDECHDDLEDLKKKANGKER